MSSSSNPAATIKGATSSELLVKQSKNIGNIRQSLADNGMWYDATDSLDGCPEFKEKVFKIFEKERPSRMREESFKRISKYMTENGTKNEATYVEGLVDPVIKSERTVATRKRDAASEVLYISQGFEDDDMVRARDVQFGSGFLPGKLPKKTESKLGLTDPKPDYTFGIKRNMYPLPGSAPTDKVKAHIGIAPGMYHPFFVIENKGCEMPIDVARNQAIRDGAAIVNARVHLNAMARDEDWERPKGANMDAIAFSCTWDVNIAELWIHWQESLEGGAVLYHMNRLGQYVTGRQAELVQFRHDVHNILDWGVLINRRKCEEEVERIMNKAKAKPKHVQQSGTGGSSGSGTLTAGSTAGSEA